MRINTSIKKISNQTTLSHSSTEGCNKYALTAFLSCMVCAIIVHCDDGTPTNQLFKINFSFYRMLLYNTHNVSHSMRVYELCKESIDTKRENSGKVKENNFKSGKNATPKERNIEFSEDTHNRPNKSQNPDGLSHCTHTRKQSCTHTHSHRRVGNLSYRPLNRIIAYTCL